MGQLFIIITRHRFVLFNQLPGSLYSFFFRHIRLWDRMNLGIVPTYVKPKPAEQEIQELTRAEANTRAQAERCANFNIECINSLP
jgi:hypothetical protein